MVKTRTTKEVFDWCARDGKYEPLEEVDADRIKTMLAIAKSTLDFVQMGLNVLKKDSPQWSAVYPNYYSVIQILADAILLLDKLKSSNHQCVFAFLCSKHSELELDWKFFEKVRTKRNGIHYYGVPASYADWKEIEVQMTLYIRTLRRCVEDQLKGLYT